METGQTNYASPLAGRIVRAAIALAGMQERTPAAVLTRCGGDPTDYDRLVAGRDITTRKATRLLDAMRAKWPAGHPFPE